MFTLISTFGISILTQLSKRLVEKYGKTAVHALIFIIALVVVAINSLVQGNPEYLAILKQAGIILAGAITLYELLLKKVFDSVNI
ncbi:MAG TPA: hypothetical protein VJH92_02865 [Candidatus Nanoarchaeia archaeon]|nr:hypothetical protein [Candidatus Nanoarchaeia archaeon]